MVQSQRSSQSQVDLDYYAYSSHSATSSLSNGRAAFPAPPTSTVLPSRSPDRARRHPSQAHAGIPSFSQFRSQVSGIPIASTTSTKRKPLPSPTRPLSASVADTGSPKLAEPASRPHSLETVQQRTPVQVYHFPSPLAEKTTSEQSDSISFNPSFRSHDRNGSNDSRVTESNPSSSHYHESRPSSIPVPSRYVHEQPPLHAPKSSVSSVERPGLDYSPADRSAVSSMQVPADGPNMRLEINGIQRTLTAGSLESLDSQDGRVPKSPGRLGSFFGWKKSSQDSLDTPILDRSPSPGLSPRSPNPNSADTAQSIPRLLPPAVLDVQKANAHYASDYFDNEATPILLGTPAQTHHMMELEKELTEVSTELAESIKREMELEDEIERMRSERSGADSARRSSDYFSDSGTSSTRALGSDLDSRVEQLEQKLRKTEQEKAQLKVEMTARLQTELNRRRDLEMMVEKMEGQLQGKSDEDSDRDDVEERVEELEFSLEDTRRLLSQERQAKSSLEDLYAATKDQLQAQVDQHHNLRDEVVPHLKSRIEGLEADSTDHQSLMYENTKMQQELAALRKDAQNRFANVAEDDSVPPMPLSRSASLARSSSRRGGSLSRSGTVTDGSRQRSGSANAIPLPEAVKEIEDQRDALHKALKLLILRSEKQQKDHERAIRKLTNAKVLAEFSTPTKGAYHKEVAFLKEEVATLRKRTEDALEQKWQYEKGLSGIKMDLDRAELETRGLRIILQEHDILGSSQRTLLGGEQSNVSGADDRLQESISVAESERDQARRIANQYRQRAETVGVSESGELTSRAKRMDELADELEKQVKANTELRSRLSEAIARGEREQKESSGKIGEMQKRLASMEDSVLTAQQHSESTLGDHEAQVRLIEEASSPALRRLTLIAPDPKRLTVSSPLLAKSPKLGNKKLSENSLLEVSKTQMLERKVKELEGLLREAEEDMQDVVTKVNKSQLEVAELQTERDAAFSQMRKLQNLIVAEREKAEDLMR